MSDPAVKELVAAAREARAQAYARYSGYTVGAAIRAASGKIYAGCNVENAAYPLSQCAEANAVAAMVLGGDQEIAAVAVVGPGGEAPCTPCGGCRQMLAEFSDAGVMVHICGPDDSIAEEALGDLIPHAFGPKNLDKAED
ncbi:MAG: cytidine deaminase [Proteobacteria bacterium]|nr:cytidine deaminase [Pseudomonadota bacterium]